MKITVKDIYNCLNDFAPFSTQAEWDNCGLTIGSFEKNVSKIYIALDVTSKVIDDAKAFGADLVITHHPIIFNPVSHITDETILYSAVISGMSFIGYHTCLDKAVGGVNYCLAESVGIKNLTDTAEDDFLKIGEVDAVSAEKFSLKLKSVLGGGVNYTDNGKLIKKIAVCSGSGGDFVGLAKQIGADALLTGEAKHHELLLSIEAGISLFSAGHFETENVVCKKIKDVLESDFSNLEIKVSEIKSPVKYTY